jgi:alpha-L-fucosidase
LTTQWGWKANDVVPPFKDVLAYLVRCAGQDGNLLLNVAPGPDGTIDANQAERLREMGGWLKKYGESIYGTRGGPYRDGPWGTSTHKGNTIYLHVLDWQGKYLYMPPTGKKIVASRLLSGGAVKTEVTPQAMRIEIAEKYRDPVDTIIVLELDGPASEIRPRHPARIGFLDGPLP